MPDDWADLTVEQQVTLLTRRLARASKALEDAETTLEQRMRALDRANVELKKRENELVERLNIENRRLLSAQRLAELATIYAEPDREFAASSNLAILLGLPEGTEVSLERLTSAIHPLDRARFQRVTENFFGSLKPEEDYTFQHRILRSDNQMRWFEWHVRRESTSVAGEGVVFAAVRDVSESRKNARQVRALQLRAERRVQELDRLAADLRSARAETVEALNKRNLFISDMAHRIRTPLGALTGTLELLVERQRGDEFATRALQAADSLATLAGQMIAAADETVSQPAEAGAPLVATTTEFSILRTAEGRAPHVLLAEDTESNAFVISGLVESLGGVVTAVTNGLDAVEAVRGGRFDAVLMDVMMPVMTGEEATRAIRAMSGPKARVPIIGISAHSLHAERESLLIAGMSQCLVKPIRRDALHAALRAALSGGEELAGRRVLFDTEVFLEAFLVLPAPVREKMLEAFRKDLSKNGAELIDAISVQNDEWTDKVAHRLKGICLNVGAKAMVDLLANLRQMPANRRGNELDSLKETITASLKACGDLYSERVAHRQ